MTQQRWAYLLRGPFVMGMLCVLVGDILQFFREGNTGKTKSVFKVLLESAL